MYRLLLLALGLIALLAASMAWSGGATSEKADFSFINRGDIITLDMDLMSYVQDFRISYATREGLYSYKINTLEPIPAAASSVDISPDKRVWTFHIRPDAKWSNDDPVLAKDFIFSWRRMLEEPGEYTYLHYYIKGAEQYRQDFQDYLQYLRDKDAHDKDPSQPAPAKVISKPDYSSVGEKVIDDHTLEVTLHDPVTYFLDIVSFGPFYPLNQGTMRKFEVTDPVTEQITYRPEFTRPPDVVTNGAYRLADWKFKRRLLLKRSENYWDKENVKIPTIEMVVAEDKLEQLLLYETGAVDWVADIPSDLAYELKQHHRPDLRVTPGFGTSFMTLNITPEMPGGGKNPLSDIRVRQALCMAIDKQAICDDITRMGEKPATTYVPPGIFKDYRTTPGFPRDIERAKKLLAEAGYPNGQGFPTVPILFSTAYPATRDMMQMIKNQWKQTLNVNFDLQSLELKIFSDRVHHKDYVIAPSTWIGDYGDVSTFTDKYLSTSLNNDSAYASKEYDDLCARAAKESDPDKRLRMLEQAEAMLNTELPVIPLYFLVNTDLCRDRVNMKFNPRMTTIFKGLEVVK